MVSPARPVRKTCSPVLYAMVLSAGARGGGPLSGLSVEDCAPCCRGEGRPQTGVSHWLVHSSKAHNCQGWARPGGPVWIPHGVAGSPPTKPGLLPPWGAQQEAGIWIGARTETQALCQGMWASQPAS